MQDLVVVYFLVKFTDSFILTCDCSAESINLLLLTSFSSDDFNIQPENYPGCKGDVFEMKSRTLTESW